MSGARQRSSKPPQAQVGPAMRLLAKSDEDEPYRSADCREES
jgi:hypothetical protein